MSEAIYKELKRIGMDEGLALELAKAVDHGGLAANEAKVGDQQEIEDFKREVRVELRSLKLSISAINRQLLLTFGGLFTTIVTLFAVKWYFF